jgi:hypothetical protein
MKFSKEEEKKEAHKNHVIGTLVVFVVGALMIVAAIAGEKIGLDTLGQVTIFCVGFLFVCLAGIYAPEP